MEQQIFYQLGISLVLGLLVGLQREHVAAGLAGMRTFPLVTLLGTVAGVAAQTPAIGGWLIGFGLFGVAAITTLSHWLRRNEPNGNGQPGITTDTALLLMYAIGVLLSVEKMMPAAVAVGGTTAVLLHFKPELHGIAEKLGDKDLRAIMQFVLITCVILPVLPDEPIDPYGVVRPWNVWLMVVLIVGMSLTGYIFYKFFGENAGILLGGLLGGAVSSTATTVSYARGARGGGATAQAAVVVIMIASSVMYVRVMIEAAVVAPQFAWTLAVPIAIALAATVLPALWLWYRLRRAETNGRGKQVADGPSPHTNPTQLRSAIIFGLTYALVLLALAASKEYLGTGGVYTVAAVSGLTEVDALTLSTARMSLEHETIMADGWRLVLVGTLTNFVAKAAIAGLLGGAAFFFRLGLAFAVPLAAGAAVLLLL